MTISNEDDIGILIGLAVKKGFEIEYYAQQADRIARTHWGSVVDYYRRQIICDVEVAIALAADDTRPLAMKSLWIKFVADMSPPRSTFSIDYRCGACGRDGLKLWRGVHGCADESGHTLKCAACLAPDVKVDDAGRAPSDLGGTTDQVGGWLPACPTGDTYWGYSSVPSVDVKWWKALPTYADATPKRRGARS